MKNLIILCLLLPLHLAQAKTAVVIHVDDDYAPYSYKEKEQAAGIYVDIIKLVAANMPDHEITIEPVPWKRGLTMLESGEIMALLPPYYRPAERPYMSYSIPILEERLVVFCREGILKDNKYIWPDDYFGLTIGKNLGFSTGGLLFNAAVSQGKVAFKEFKGAHQNFISLSKKNTDCYMNDKISILWNFQQLKSSNQLPRLKSIEEGATISVENGYLGITKNDNGKFPFKDSFVEQFNAIIKKMQESNAIDAIVKQYTS